MRRVYPANGARVRTAARRNRRGRTPAGDTRPVGLCLGVFADAPAGDAARLSARKDGAPPLARVFRRSGRPESEPDTLKSEAPFRLLYTRVAGRPNWWEIGNCTGRAVPR